MSTYDSTGIRSLDFGKSTEKNPYYHVEDPEYQAIYREKDYAEDLQQKYEAQVIAHSRTEAKISELELLLEQERNRAKEVRNDILKELEQEKLMRQHAEENLLSLKEEAMRKEIEDNRQIQDMEIKFKNLQHEKTQFQVEFSRLKESLDRTYMQSSDKIKLLEDRLLQQQRITGQVEESHRQQLEKIKQNSHNELFTLQKEWERRIMMNQEEAKRAQIKSEEVQNEINQLKALIQKSKTGSQQEMIQMQQQLKSEADNKYTTITSQMQAKIKTLQEYNSKQQLQNQRLQQELLQNEQSIQESNVQLEQELTQLNKEKNNLYMEQNQWSRKIEQLQNELILKQTQCDKLDQDQQEFQYLLQQKEEQHRSAYQETTQECEQERKSQENSKDLNRQRITDLEKQLCSVNMEIQRVKSLHVSFNYQTGKTGRCSQGQCFKKC